MSGTDHDVEQADVESEASWRRPTAAVLLLLLFISAALANISVWLQTTISETDDFVSTFAPLPDDVPVAELLGQSIANAAVDPQTLASSLTERLPDQLQPLAVPIATSVNELAADAATRMIESDAFQAIWDRTLRAAHTAVLDLISLRNAAQVVIVDVTEAADELADRLQGLGIEVTVPDAPTITLIQTNQSPVVINLLRFVYTTGWVFPAVFALLLAAVVFVRKDRRSAVVSIGLITATAMLFDLVLMRILRTTVSDQASESAGVQALRAAWDTVTSRLHWQTWIVLLVALVTAGIAHYAGTERGASYPSPALAGYLRRWGTLTQGAVIVLALAAMLMIPAISLGLAILITALAGAAIFVIALGMQRAETSVE